MAHQARVRQASFTKARPVGAAGLLAAQGDGPMASSHASLSSSLFPRAIRTFGESAKCHRALDRELWEDSSVLARGRSANPVRDGTGYQGVADVMFCVVAAAVAPRGGGISALT